MASIYKEILIDAAADRVWDAVRDVGALHTRLAPGVVLNTKILPDVEPLTRLVTFADGLQLREVIVDCDDQARRLVWTIESEKVAHHNGAMQVFDAEGGCSRVVWIADVLPDALGEPFGAIMNGGMAAMKRQLESRATN